MILEYYYMEGFESVVPVESIPLNFIDEVYPARKADFIYCLLQLAKEAGTATGYYELNYKQGDRVNNVSINIIPSGFEDIFIMSLRRKENGLTWTYQQERKFK